MFQLVEATYGAEFGQIVHPPLNPKLLDLPPEFPWHDGAVLYQKRNAPLLSGTVMDSAHKGFAIFAAAASGLFVLWQWSRQYGQQGRDKGFNKYIPQVTRIEEQAMRAEQDGSLALIDLLALQGQLGRLKIQALDEFAGGELTGNDLLSGFLVQINDTRDQLARMILHREAGGEADHRAVPARPDTVPDTPAPHELLKGSERNNSSCPLDAGDKGGVAVG
jgi:hypothetical protein